MPRARKTTVKKIEPSTEALARAVVNGFIEMGLMTWDMKDYANRVVLQFQDFLIRDIDLWARTGKYPQYAESDAKYDKELEDAKVALAAFAALERRNCLAYEFVALKLGCSNDYAANLVKTIHQGAIGIPYFAATLKDGGPASVCPACNQIVVGSPANHWTEANHTEADVTPATREAAMNLANKGLL